MELKEQLEKEGYYVGDHIEYLLVGIGASFDEELGVYVLQKAFRVKINPYAINYFIGQIPVEKEFKSIEELIKFVKQVFPIEE